MAVKAEIAGQKAKSGTYNATDTASVAALKTIVETDLVSTGSGFTVENPVDGASGAKVIKIRYSNTALKAGGIDEGVPAQNGHVNYKITVTAGDAELTENITDEAYEAIGTASATEVTVSFYKESELTNLIATKTVTAGTAIGNSNMPANPTKEADTSYTYTFARWKVGENEFTGETTVSADTSVYAEWTATAKTPAVSPTATFGAAHPTLKADFGKKVSGYNAKSGSNWRLFYADTNFAYLISDSIGNKALNDSTLFSNFSTATMSDLGKNLNPGCSTAFWTNNAGYNNVKGISGLLNTAKWTDYATNSSNESIANWAVGAPTVEMFKASYNATHTEEAIAAYKATAGHGSETLTQTQIDCQVASDSAYGYEVKKGSEGFANYTSGLGNSSALDKAIYCPDSGYWWLASPSANGNGSVMLVHNSISGRLSGYSYISSYGVRPLVSVPISKIGNGITITSNY